MTDDAQLLAQLEERGYCVVPDVIPAGRLKSVRASVLATTAKHRNPNAPPTLGHVPGLMALDQSFAPFLADPKLMAVITPLLGQNVKITFTTGQTNHSGCERQEFHADWPFAQTGSAHVPAPCMPICGSNHHLQIRRAEYTTLTIGHHVGADADAVCHLTTLWMLDDMTDLTGTVLLPGTHRKPTNPTMPGVLADPLAPQPGEVRAMGTAGSVLLFDSRLWHAIPPNPTPRSRVAFAVRYAPWWLDTTVVTPRGKKGAPHKFARGQEPAAAAAQLLIYVHVCGRALQVMLGSAARARLVDGAGRPADVGAKHAGIPLGNPSQPAAPPAVVRALKMAGGGEARTAALYEHWPRPGGTSGLPRDGRHAPSAPPIWDQTGPQQLRLPPLSAPPTPPPPGAALAVQPTALSEAAAAAARLADKLSHARLAASAAPLTASIRRDGFCVLRRLVKPEALPTALPATAASALEAAARAAG